MSRSVTAVTPARRADKWRGGDAAYKWIAFAAIGSFFITAVLALTMVFVALPAMADEFDVTLKAASWIVIAPSLTISALLLPFGRLADLLGRRRVHLTGLVLFAIGAALTALAPTFGWLLAARVVMAVGSALAESVGTAILVSVFPTTERGKAIGSQTSAVAVGAAGGPLAAGLALQFLSWRALFWLLVVMTVFCFVLGAAVLDEERISATGRERAPFDLVGAALSTLTVVLLVVTLNNPLDLAWASWPVIVSALAVVAGLVGFIRWELRCPHPMLQLRFFADPVFARCITSRSVGFVASSTVNILIPVLLVSVAGFSEGRAGIAVFLNSVGLGVAAQTAGRLSDRFGARAFMVGGFGSMAVMMLAFSMMGETTPLWQVSVVALLAGLATGTWNVTNNATVMGSVPPTAYGVVGAFTNLARNIGNVFGQAAVAVIVTSVMVARGFDIPLGDIADTPGAGAAFVHGWQVAFRIMAGLAGAAGALMLTLRPQALARTASSSPQQPGPQDGATPAARP